MEPQRIQGLLVLARTCGTHTLWAVHRPSFTAPSYKIIKSQPLGLSLLSVGGLSVVRVSVVRAHPSEIKDFSAIFAMFADAFVCPPLNLKLLLFIHRHSNCVGNNHLTPPDAFLDFQSNRNNSITLMFLAHKTSACTATPPAPQTSDHRLTPISRHLSAIVVAF